MLILFFYLFKMSKACVLFVSSIVFSLLYLVVLNAKLGYFNMRIYSPTFKDTQCDKVYIYNENDFQRKNALNNYLNDVNSCEQLSISSLARLRYTSSLYEDWNETSCEMKFIDSPLQQRNLLFDCFLQTIDLRKIHKTCFLLDCFKDESSICLHTDLVCQAPPLFDDPSLSTLFTAYLQHNNQSTPYPFLIDVGIQTLIIGSSLFTFILFFLMGCNIA